MTDEFGPLTRTVLAFTAAQQEVVPRAGLPGFTSADWSPVAEFVDVEAFERVGTRMEVMDWDGFTEMLTRWASHIGSFETTIRRVTELPGLVYFGVEERHAHGETTTVVNSLTVFEFNDDGKIRRLEVYLQQAR